MGSLHLIVGNKNYSSWSLRAWLVLRQAGIAFTEETIWLDTPTAREQKLARSPAGRVPILEHDGLAVWDSLAICEYVAELHPDRGLWPEERAARARARSLCCEMHAGFADLRCDLPFNARARRRARRLRPEVEQDVRRIAQIWQDAPREYGAAGPFLFGGFGIVDAFFAPVASRFLTYSVELPSAADAYARTLLALPAMQEWLTAAAREDAQLPSVDRVGG